VKLYIFLTSVLGEGVNVTLQPLCLEKRSGVHCAGGWMGVRSVWTGVGQRKTLSRTGFRTPNRPARSKPLHRLHNPAAPLQLPMIGTDTWITKNLLRRVTKRTEHWCLSNAFSTKLDLCYQLGYGGTECSVFRPAVRSTWFPVQWLVLVFPRHKAGRA
jgi:hypothetical protein